MLTFFQSNWTNLLVGGLVLALLAGALRALRRSHKKGAPACGCGGCAKCPYASNCRHN